MDGFMKQQVTDFTSLVDREMVVIKQAADRIVDATKFCDELDGKKELSFAEKYMQLYLNKIFDFMDEIKEMSEQAPLAAKALFMVINHSMSAVPAPTTEAEATKLLTHIILSSAE